MGDDLQGFSIDERNRTHVLVVEADPSLRAAMRAALGSLGFGGVSDAPNHALALGKLGSSAESVGARIEEGYAFEGKDRILRHP
jgi:hypothetical protein